MATTDVQIQFNAALDQLEGVAPPPATLVGAWTTVDPATRGIVKIVITAAGDALMVHAYGACSPTPCDWGQVRGHTYGPNVSTARSVAFTANYSFGFKSTLLAGHLQDGMLVVESFDAFAAGDTRSDYYSVGQFHR